MDGLGGAAFNVIGVGFDRSFGAIRGGTPRLCLFLFVDFGVVSSAKLEGGKVGALGSLAVVFDLGFFPWFGICVTFAEQVA
jgi:hypothetical protein